MFNFTQILFATLLLGFTALSAGAIEKSDREKIPNPIAQNNLWAEQNEADIPDERQCTVGRGTGRRDECSTVSNDGNNHPLNEIN